MDYVNINEKAWTKLANEEYIWSKPVSTEEVINAKNGEWDIVLTPKKTVPKSWYPTPLAGKDVLCLASGGGQQGPIMAAVGANVTVFDYCEAQLDADRMVAKRDSLVINTVQGDMRDLSMFEDESFDFIIHPLSNCFVDDVLPIWKESYRVLRKGGILTSGFANPVEYIFDYEKIEQGELVVSHKIPYSDLTSITDEERDKLISQVEPMCFGHTLHDQIQGQIEAGF